MDTVAPPVIRVNYEEYIKSADWQVKRKAALSRAGGRCQLCRGTKRLNVHHNTYANLGDERDEDLVVLCKKCHDIYHVKRDGRTREKMKARGVIVPDVVDVLPSNPVIAPAPDPAPLAPTRGRAKPTLPAQQASAATGEKRAVLVTKEYVESLISPNGGITYRGLRLLGEPIPWQNDWRHRPVGKTVEVDVGELETELAVVRAKHAGTHQRGQHGPKQPERTFTKEEAECVRAEYAANPREGKKRLAERWGCRKGAIRRILRGMDYNAA